MTFLDALQISRVRYRRNGDEVQLNCPFCPERRGEKDFNLCLHVNVASGAGKCWHAQCDFKGRHILNMVLRQLRVEVAVLEGNSPPEAIKQEPVTLPKDFQLLTHTYDLLDKKALAYLQRRGITSKEIAERHIGVSYSGRYAYRIIIPVMVEGDLRGIVARDFTGHHQPKYLNSVGDKYLYGFRPEEECCIFVEGVFKALRVEQATHWNVAALLGHDLTDIQLKQIKSSRCKRIIFFPDPDLVGRRGVANMAEKLLEEWSGEIQVVWPVTEPADEMAFEALRGISIEPYSWELRQRLLLNSPK